MWPRITELFIALWLAISPWILPRDSTEVFPGETFFCAFLIASFAVASFRRSWERAHLLNLVVAAWLITRAFLFPYSPPPPAYQNFVVVALLLFIFSILPTHTHAPPRAWQEHFLRETEED